MLARIDSLTRAELDSVRTAVKRDLSSLPSSGFGLFAVEDDEEELSPVLSARRSKKDVAGDEEMRDRPPTPASTIESSQEASSQADGLRLPFSIFAPEKGHEMFGRAFAWGRADVMDPEQSDFIALRDAMLGTHIKVSSQPDEVDGAY